MFAKAMTTENYTTTWNGAKSLATPDMTELTTGRVSLFFKSIRGVSDDQLYDYIEKASNEDIVDAIILSFHIRDCRGGKGEREIGRKLFLWLFKNRTEEFSKVVSLITQYGRWDDLLTFFPLNDFSLLQIEVRNTIVAIFCNQIEKDTQSMNEGNPISLSAKWAPTEGDSDDRKYNLVQVFCVYMGISKRDYRKKIVALRSYLNIVEKLMCENKWSEIDFNKVPSCAMLKLKNAFAKHVPEQFKEWKSGLEKGTTKVNAKQLYPHDVIREIRTKGSDEVTEAQWKVIIEEARKLGSFANSVVVVDTSSSMHDPNYLPIDVACAMGLLISDLVEGEFHNNVITFNDIPEFVLLRDGSLAERYDQLSRIPWGGSTNIQATFDLILNKCRDANLTEDQMPKRLYIVSDMQFNQIGGVRYYTTNFEEIDRKYALYGYKRPEIVFWNVNGKSTDFPVSVSDEGTIMVSGASPSVLEAIYKSTSFDTFSIIRQIIDGERYQPIKDLLSA
jgi:hypothetical protein